MIYQLEVLCIGQKAYIVLTEQSSTRQAKKNWRYYVTRCCDRNVIEI